MANTIKVTNRIIEISDIDSDYMMSQELNVQSVILIPGIYFLKQISYVYIVENSSYDSDPVKVKLISSIGFTEPRVWLFNQRLQLGFVYADCHFNPRAKVIFNLRPEIKKEDKGNFGLSTKMKLKAEDAIL